LALAAAGIASPRDSDMLEQGDRRGLSGSTTVSPG
jgi:hypothetical protein